MNNTANLDKSEDLTLKGGEISRFISRLVTKSFFGMLVLAVATVVRLIQRGGFIRYWLLLGGSILSILTLFAFSVFVIWDKGKKKKGIFPMLLSFSPLVAYFFGCYLFFYEGAWRLFRTFKSFSWWSLVLSLLFITLGYITVSATYKVSEFARKIDAGTIRILE